MRKNKDHLWEEAMRAKIKKIESLNIFIIQDSEENIPNEFKFILVHFVFDIKYDGRKKVRLVAGGHLTNPNT